MTGIDRSATATGDAPGTASLVVSSEGNIVAQTGPGRWEQIARAQRDGSAMALMAASPSTVAICVNADRFPEEPDLCWTEPRTDR